MIEMPKIDLNKNDWQELSSILRRVLPEYEVWAFGSRVKWTAKAYSDLDFAIITSTPFSFEKLATIKEAFDESNLPFRVDIVDWAATSKSFQDIISKDKITIQQPSINAINSNWRPYRIREIGKVITGKTPSSNDPLNNGFDVPFVTPPDFSGQKWIKKTSRTISRQGAESVKKSIVPKNSVLVTCIGSDMGKAAITSHECVTNQQINAIIVDELRFSPEYIFYNLSLRQQEIKNIAGGSAQPILNKSDFSDLWIDCPPLITQKKIVKIISPIDDRITLLRETNTTLEAIAQALFKSWFVDFDPVHAKQQGREPEGMDANTAALFPDSFEESELGLVPMGWRVQTLADFSNNQSSTFNFANTDKVIFINTGDVSEGQFLHSNYSLCEGLPGQAKKAILENDILFSEIRPKNKRFAYVNFDPKEYVVSTKFMVLRAINKIAPRYLYQILRQSETIEFFNMIAESRSGTFPQITFDSIKNLKIIRPSDEIITKFVECMEPIFHKIDLTNKQKEKLEELRDTLLPRLISGQLRLQELA